MQQAQQIDFKLTAVVRKRRKWYLATCPVLDLASQGPTAEKAMANLKDAVLGFVADCFERGVLDEVLKNAGFGPPESGLEISRTRRRVKGTRYINVPFYLLRGQQSHREA